MYEYKFVKIPFKGWSGKPVEDYREIIIEHAAEGWRFIQIFSPDLAPSGIAAATYYELIFEREVNRNEVENNK